LTPLAAQLGQSAISGDRDMGMWIELFVFGLVFVFAWHQFRDLKREKAKREEKKRLEQQVAPEPTPTRDE
jgi:hypothetical protein